MSKYRDQLKGRQEESFENKDGGFSPKTFEVPSGVEVYKPRAGTNKIDIIPFIDADGRAQYVFEYYQHIGVGIDNERAVCLAKTLKKPCPICEHKAKEQAAGRKWDEDDIRAMAPKRRCMYNVIDLLEPEKGIQIFEVSHFLFEANLTTDLKEYNEATGEDIVFSDLEDGRTISFKGREGEFNGRTTVNRFDSFTFLKRAKPYAESILKKAVPLDQILLPKSYDDLAALYFAIPSDDEDDEDETPPKSRKRKDPYEGEPFPGTREEVQDEEEQEPEPPRKKPAAKKAAALECPVGLKFGKDFDGYVECDECEHRKACSEAQ